jgi:hypothetical protein
MLLVARSYEAQETCSWFQKVAVLNSLISTLGGCFK